MHHMLFDFRFGLFHICACVNSLCCIKQKQKVNIFYFLNVENIRSQSKQNKKKKSEVEERDYILRIVYDMYFFPWLKMKIIMFKYFGENIFFLCFVVMCKSFFFILRLCNIKPLIEACKTKLNKPREIQLKVTPKMMIIVMIILIGEFKQNSMRLCGRWLFVHITASAVYAQSFSRWLSRHSEMNGTTPDGRQLKTFNLALSYDLLLINLMHKHELESTHTPRPNATVYLSSKCRMRHSFTYVVICLNFLLWIRSLGEPSKIEI